ncbi:MAG: hypothetical protein QXJ75_00495 [Candidatus Bathyarchaeia archaeon]
MRREDFWFEWFGLFGREVGNPFRFFVDNPIDFVKFVEKCEAAKSPVFMSVNHYRDRDTVYALDKLFFDFDNATEPEKAIYEALQFAEILKRFYHAEPLIVRSGLKGAGVYVFFPQAITGAPEDLAEVYRKVASLILKGLQFSTLDHQVLGDVKRLSRVPYTRHEKSGQMCIPINEKGVEVNLSGEDLAKIRERSPLPAHMLKLAWHHIFLERKVRAGEGNRNQAPPFNKIRTPVQDLILLAKAGAHLSHHGYLAILFELINNGYTDDQILSLFRTLFKSKFNEKETRYFITHARKKRYLPFSISRVKHELNLLSP